MRSYPGAVVARIPLSGVTAVVGDAGHAWVIRTIGQDGIDHGYQLAGIDLRTNAIMFRTHLGRQPRAIAAGDGRLWLTTPSGQARGQIVRVDLATGQVLSTLHLPAGRCDFLAFSSGLLFAGCRLNGPGRTAFWRINPVTQRPTRLAGTLNGYISSMIASPQAVWYVVNLMRVGGVINAGGNPHGGLRSTTRASRTRQGDRRAWCTTTDRSGRSARARRSPGSTRPPAA